MVEPGRTEATVAGVEQRLVLHLPSRIPRHLSLLPFNRQSSSLYQGIPQLRPPLPPLEHSRYDQSDDMPLNVRRGQQELLTGVPLWDTDPISRQGTSPRIVDHADTIGTPERADTLACVEMNMSEHPVSGNV